mmetsp:Transcript_73297/g.238507  ORF Transcript_73297/g.238507 Transcript_73297/m.238507 type:complete len:251 (-) Transcript_73297:1219-1971(-)
MCSITCKRNMEPLNLGGVYEKNRLRSNLNRTGTSSPPSRTLASSHFGYGLNRSSSAGQAGKVGCSPSSPPSNIRRSTLPVTASRGNGPAIRCKAAPRGAAARTFVSSVLAAAAPYTSATKPSLPLPPAPPREGTATKTCAAGAFGGVDAVTAVCGGEGSTATSGLAAVDAEPPDPGDISARAAPKERSASPRSMNWPATLTSWSLRPQNSMQRLPAALGTRWTRSRVRKNGCPPSAAGTKALPSAPGPDL